ncbi:50S ribosomal protein L11 methyltransferase [Oscillatoria sp. FACHB-1407]|uniref:50S ribosomal protein L11 methyltransferase n=1 Tax=Oscillatoria sp. FACHB-1407 TaxID=2692847 RepID=UPI001688B899|nr:50S ribosomal protein L11 methyltransferase [Oscillatoria sp. FACHB-1407]MBD2461269.1 50S ribosomal protein L11 methyltransferase [Oscillatoria sp. FACHB-1407]
MSWTELIIHTTHEAVDWVSTLLASIDYRGEMYVRDYTGDLSVHPEEDQPDWAFTIHLYLPGQTPQVQLEAIHDTLFPLQRIGLVTLAESVVLQEKPSDMASVHRQSHRIGNHFVILPENAPHPHQTSDDVILHLGDSLAFGSGLHPATMLSLQLLERYVTPAMQTLDLGSGTGILSVAMAKLGAQVLALDNDPVAVQATQDSIQRNHIDQQVTVFEGSLGSGSQMGHWMGGDLEANVRTFSPAHDFDLIVANILARIHMALAPDLHKALRRNAPHQGILITAGFTTDYQDEVKAALTDAGFESIDAAQQDEWIALVHRLKA